MELLRVATSPAPSSNQRVEPASRWKAAPALSGPEKDDDDAPHLTTKTSLQHDDCTIITDNDDEREDREQRESTQAEDDEVESEIEPFAASVQCEQLQDDVDVLAAHLEAQTLEREAERTAMRRLQNQLQHANMELARELHSARIENDALRRQHALLQTERDALANRAVAASETQDELLLALRTHQQHAEQLQHANVLVVRERTHVRKALEATQNHCRRLEEELAALQTRVMQLERERAALEAAAAATDTTQLSREAKQIARQDGVIASLRADLLQMEFEYKTFARDRDALNEQVGKLQRQLSASRSSAGACDVVPLGGNAAAATKQQQRQFAKEQAKRQQQQQQQQLKVKAKKTIRPARSQYESENGGFSGVMELPNFVHDQRDSSRNSSSSGMGELETTAAPSGALHRSSSFSSLVSKTMASTRKRLFAPAPATKLVRPQ